MVTKDGVPVLSHDPFLTQGYVSHADGRAIEDKILVCDLTLGQLQQDFKFGLDPEDPEGSTSDSVGPTTLEDVLVALQKYPGVLLYLDVKIERAELKMSRTPADVAKAVFDLWRTYALPNKLWAEAGDKEIADAYLAAGAGIDFEMALSFPRFHSDENDIMEVVGAGILDFTGDRNPCTECSDVGIGAYTAHHQFVTKLHVHEAGRRNLRAILFGVGDVETLIEHMTLPMPAYMLICDDTKEVREAIAVYS